jgi:TetR/AcrR family transcriptional regulator, tetracycline repressor protein
MSRRPGERAGLTQEAVIAAAREIAEREGVDGLSLRRLAGALGVAPNAIYSHVPSKTALLDEVLEDMRGDIEIPDLDAGDWRDGLVALMSSSRRVVAAHPALIPMFLARPARGPNARRLGEATLALLERGGITGERAVEALRALLVFTLGFAAFEAPRRDDPDPDSRRTESETAFASDERLSRLHALAPQLARHADDRTFEHGLRWLIAGMEAA